MKKLILLSVLLLAAPAAWAQKFEGLAPTPPMGWNSWNTFEVKIDEKLIKETAEALIANGMLAAGYNTIVIDDGWEAMERDAQGNLIPDPGAFPERPEGPRRLPALEGLQVRHPQLRRAPRPAPAIRAAADTSSRTRAPTPPGASTT